jgi:hypothetical protein
MLLCAEKEPAFDEASHAAARFAAHYTWRFHHVPAAIKEDTAIDNDAKGLGSRRGQSITAWAAGSDRIIAATTCQ